MEMSLRQNSYQDIKQVIEQHYDTANTTNNNCDLYAA